MASDKLIKVVPPRDPSDMIEVDRFYREIARAVNELHDDAMRDSAHRHSELSASDGTPDQVVTVDENGDVIIGAGQEVTVGDGIVVAVGGLVTIDNFIRSGEANYRRYYHIPIAAFDPGASGATWVNPDANTLGGWRLDNAGELIFSKTDIHADWDGDSDIDIELSFECNVNNVGGLVTDTVDIKLTAFYKGAGEAVNKTQIVEVAVVVGQSAQYKLFHVHIPLAWDYAGNNVQAGDALTLCFNLETDTSEVDNIIITDGSISYKTTHIGIEDGDT